MRALVCIHIDRKRILMPEIVAWQEWCDDPVEGKDCHYQHNFRCGLFGVLLTSGKGKPLRCFECMEMEK